jgi:membrane-associated phospholipid phosphatase
VHIQYPLWSIEAQQLLLNEYVTSQTGMGSGISSMPSMHVAIAGLCTFFLWNIHKGLGCVAGLFTAIVLVGSVHLGWHYAIDGYVSIAGVAMIWWLADYLSVAVNRTVDHLVPWSAADTLRA